MKFISIISDPEKEQLKKQGSIPVKIKDEIIGVAYINDKDSFIIEIFDDKIDKIKEINI